jgi:tetratricopeptide (TPR) repeat protein
MASLRSDPEEDASLEMAFIDGVHLSAPQARRLERRVTAHPEDLEARLRLLGHHRHRSFHAHGSRLAVRRHLAWVVEHRPELGVESLFVLSGATLRRGDPVGFRMIERRWQAAVKRHGNDPRVLDHAASFLRFQRPRTALALWKRAARLEPKEPRWLVQIAQLHRFQGAYHRELATLELALKMDGPRSMLIEEIAEAALRTGDRDKAARRARELLRAADAVPRDWDYGNAVHTGHIVLGKIAAARGRLAVAERHLIAAGDTPGSPQLNSFGPDLDLARDLLERGCSKTVIAYLNRIAKFWESRRDALARCVREIEAGRRPRLEAHALERAGPKATRRRNGSTRRARARATTGSGSARPARRQRVDSRPR